jgi:hypothetical protein
MFLKYGNYTASDGETTVVITKENRLNEAKVPIARVERWTIEGILHANDAAGLTVAINALETAFSVNGRRLALLLPDNSTESAHVISAASVPRIMRISYPDGSGPQYVNQRSYSIEIEAEIAIAGSGAPGGANDLLKFEESVSIQGTGGPRRVIREYLNGPPIVQQTAQATAVYATQTGSATGYHGYYKPMPIWPAHEILDAREITKKNPKATKNQAGVILTDYEISWNFRFQAPGQIAGGPRNIF